jgi:nucleoside-diphosphate-sugar epimerase
MSENANYLNVLWTGCDGFVAQHAIEKLLNEGHSVWGIDNFSKYKKRRNYFNNHVNFFFIELDAKDTESLIKIINENAINSILNAAAVIGGLQIIHEQQYALLRENELINIAAFEASVFAHKNFTFFKKIVVISSSMVYENVDSFPTKENIKLIAPNSSYGFQKLMCEYFAKSAYEQHGLNYTIIRPSNVIGNDKSSHVIPDLITKINQGEYPLSIFGTGKQFRHYTYTKDIANGFYECITNENALNETFNISTSEGYTVVELAKLIWDKLKPEQEFKYILKPGYKNDVEKNNLDVSKAKELLNFECKTDLSKTLDIIINNLK